MRLLLIAVILASAAATPLRAQDRWVGLSGGALDARFDGPPTAVLDDRRGWSFGVFADVALPFRPIDARVEARWVRRGASDEDGQGAAESDLLAFPIAVGPRLHAGPVSLFPFLGFEFAYPIANRQSVDYRAGFANRNTIELGGLFGASVDLRLPAELKLGLEYRRLSGWSPSFEGSQGGLDIRATEFTVRVARPLR